jgi:hypothetical protein
VLIILATSICFLYMCKSISIGFTLFSYCKIINIYYMTYITYYSYACTCVMLNLCMNIYLVFTYFSCIYVRVYA